MRAEFADFTPPAAVTPTPARNSEDYPKVDGTLAHWRAPKDAEGVVEPGTQLPDLTGANPMRRAPLNTEGVTGASADQVRFSTQRPPGSAGGSICFTGAGDDAANWFATAADAPVNGAEFANGYTFETFVKIDPSWTVEDNAWMAWLSRDGVRGKIDGYAGGDAEEPPMSWAFSTLQETQFTSAGANGGGDTSWSSEMPLGQWMHLAAVNDPGTRTTTTYVNGIPMLRTAVGVSGVATADLPWVLGAGSWNGERGYGFVGCVGETRLVDRPLGQDQWLTARVADPGPEPSVSPTPSSSPTPTVNPTPTGSPMPTGSPTPGVSPTPVGDLTPTADPVPSGSPEPSPSATTTPTPSAAAAGGDDGTSGPRSPLADTGGPTLALLIGALTALATGGVMLRRGLRR